MIKSMTTLYQDIAADLFKVKSPNSDQIYVAKRYVIAVCYGASTLRVNFGSNFKHLKGRKFKALDRQRVRILRMIKGRFDR